MNKMAKAAQISQQTKKRVWDRDGHCCVICGCHVPVSCANAHVVRRSKGGMGVPANIVTLCPGCHNDMDNGGKEAEYQAKVREYLRGWYPDWNEKDVIYDKYAWIKEAK